MAWYGGIALTLEKPPPDAHPHVGTNRLPSGKLVDDVDPDAMREIAGAYTPVPGGVGPLTIALLMKNTVKAARGFSS